MKFQVVVIDCPFEFGDLLKMSGVKRGAEANYSTLSIEQLKQLPIKQLADPNGCLLALWVPSSMLQDGLDLMKAWNFVQKQTYIWVKTKHQPLKELAKTLKPFTDPSILDLPLKDIKDRFKSIANTVKDAGIDYCLSFNLGRLFRQTHEICLIGINNNLIYRQLENKSQRSVCFDINLKHSCKSEKLQNSLELMFPSLSINKLEVFARRERKNWICVGNEAPKTKGQDIFVSLNNLINK